MSVCTGVCAFLVDPSKHVGRVVIATRALWISSGSKRGENMCSDRTILLKIEEVARMFSIQPKTIMEWTSRGILPAIKISRTTRYRLSDVESLIASHSTDKSIRGESNDVG